MSSGVVQQHPPPVENAHPDGGWSGPDEHEMSLLDLLQILHKRFLAILGVTLLGVLAAMFYSSRVTPQYEGKSLVNIDPGRSTDVGVAGVISDVAMGDTIEKLQTEAMVIKSNTVLLDVIKTMDLPHKKPFSDVFARDGGYKGGEFTPAQRELLLEMLNSALTVTLVPNTKLIEIRFRNQDPQVATDVPNKLVQLYADHNLQDRYEGTMRISTWLSGQLEGIKQQATEGQKKLGDFERSHNLIGIDETGGLVADTLRQVNVELTSAEADRITKEARLKLSQSGNPELISAVAPSTTLNVLRSQHAELLVQYAALSSRFGSGYPRLKELQDQLAKVQSDIDREVTNITKRLQEEYDTSARTEDLLRQQLEAQKQRAYDVSQGTAEYEILRHEVQSAQDLYDALQERLKEASITAGLTGVTINVVDQARIPAYPVEPRRVVNLSIGFGVGLFLGMVLAFVLEALDDTLRTSESVEQVSKLPVLTVVPHQVFSSKSAGATNVPGGRKKLVTLYQSKSRATESFRLLRSSLLLSGADVRLKTIMITSSFEGEGKSTIASNTAVVLAQNGARVLLVDADLRRGTIHDFFGMERKNGLSMVLSGQAGESAYYNPVTELPNLTVLPCGPQSPNPGALLSSRTLVDTVEQWRRDYDYVIIDSAPILPVADSLYLPSIIDAVVLVVRAGLTRKKALQRTRMLLMRVHARIAGIVVNDIDLRIENFYTYSGRYGYNYSYGSNYYEEKEG
ncbi:MAG TPA: polysaccharide biosynthesis tyrosine autokinase [Acidisarcina sp.]